MPLYNLNSIMYKVKSISGMFAGIFCRKSKLMSSTSLNTALTGKMEQLQQLSQSQLHSLEILALPQIALESRLMEEFAGNPVLEELPPELPANEDFSAGSDPGTDENDYGSAAAYADNWQERRQLPARSSGGGSADYLGNSPAPPPSLKTVLVSELSCSACPEYLVPAALEIISALDDDGFLTAPLADIAMSCDADMDEITGALQWVQSVAPAGVAARDVAESLKLQLIRKGALTPNLEKLLSEGLEELEKNQIPALCNKLSVSPEELESMLKTLRQLNPAPGRETDRSMNVIVPDLEIIRNDDGSFRTEVKYERQSRLAISQTYENMAKDPALSAEDHAYITEKLARAKELIHAVAMRGSTLSRIGDVIIAEQRGFLEHGVLALKPLTMKHAARILDLNESTVSRAVAEKYAATPQGIFPLRFFFTGGFNTDGGDEVALQAVKAMIRKAISEEDPRAPLSDEALAGKLRSEGVALARRTVAKYRESMKIPTSSLRKKHF